MTSPNGGRRRGGCLTSTARSSRETFTSRPRRPTSARCGASSTADRGRGRPGRRPLPVGAAPLPRLRPARPRGCPGRGPRVRAAAARRGRRPQRRLPLARPADPVHRAHRRLRRGRARPGPAAPASALDRARPGCCSRRARTRTTARRSTTGCSSRATIIWSCCSSSARRRRRRAVAPTARRRARPPAEMVRGELAWAITHGRADRVRLLVSHGVDVAAPFEDGSHGDVDGRDHRAPGAHRLPGRTRRPGAWSWPRPTRSSPPRSRPTVSAWAGCWPAHPELSRATAPGASRADAWAAACGSAAAVEFLAELGFDVNARRADRRAERPALADGAAQGGRGREPRAGTNAAAARRRPGHPRSGSTRPRSAGRGISAGQALIELLEPVTQPDTAVTDTANDAYGDSCGAVAGDQRRRQEQGGDGRPAGGRRRARARRRVDLIRAATCLFSPDRRRR